MRRNGLEVHPAVHEELNKRPARGLPASRSLGTRASDDAGLLGGLNVQGSPLAARTRPSVDGSSSKIPREAPTAAERFLTVGEVLALTSWSRSTLYRCIRASRFPKPRILSANRIGFLSSDVAGWVRSREPR